MKSGNWTQQHPERGIFTRMCVMRRNSRGHDAARHAKRVKQNESCVTSLCTHSASGVKHTWGPALETGAAE